jgi:hypothetical protein
MKINEIRIQRVPIEYAYRINHTSEYAQNF